MSLTLPRPEALSSIWNEMWRHNVAKSVFSSEFWRGGLQIRSLMLRRRNDARAQRTSAMRRRHRVRRGSRPDRFGQVAGSSSKLNVRSAEPLTSAYCNAASALRISSAGLIAAAATFVIAQ